MPELPARPRVLAVIPARGGSKGVPRKNLRELAGRPLIAWTIAQAIACREALAATGTADVDVVVSTEDDEIASVAREFGADVPFARPAELAQDTTATEPVVHHAIDRMRTLGRAPDIVMLLQATSPIRLPGTLERAVHELLASGADSMVGVVPQAPFLWRAGDPPRPDYAVDARPRRQDLTPETLRYRETGSVYVTRTEVYAEHDNRLGGRIVLLVMDEAEGIDIDSEVDIAVADAVLRSRTDQPAPARAPQDKDAPS